MNDTIVVSVYCVTYNHEKYITEALDSILMQKVTFPIEILVGEDCSTDNTKAILKDYEEKHPGKMTVFYRDHNLNNEIITNSKDLKMRCRGKYIIALEGDDYWTDEYKLQKQVDFLESNPQFIAVAHNCFVVDANSKPTGEQFPECKENEYTFAHYITEIMPGQTTTLLMRNIYNSKILDTSFVDFPLMPGDRRLFFTLLANGRIFCLQETMSAYRHITTEGSSYSANIKRDFNKALLWHKAQLDYAFKTGNKQAIHCAELLLLLTIRKGVIKKDISAKEALQQMNVINHKIYTLLLMGKRDINRFILKKRLDI